MPQKRCAVFASGGGSNFQSLIDQQVAGHLHVDLALLICNNSKSGAMERARKHDIPAIHCAPSHFSDQISYADQLLSLLREYRIEIIALAGYMKKLPAPVIHAYADKILNIHPALLPAFGGKGMYGHFVHEAVIAAGVRVSGITVHLINEEYDEGPIILQETVPVFDTDSPQTLADRVLVLEHASYWRALEAVACNNITIRNNRAYGTV